ncbi:transposase [Desulfoluna sp.]|uniref:transposase n=1 Tax=Desulfoluna sp. TaxID=2045199 RepID=UPI00260168E5|nr:transposase [Desulfoluna sp.]
MPRIPRMVMTDPGQKTVYHVISRTALDGFPFKHAEKDELVRVIKTFSMVYAVDVLGFSALGNHFHLLVEMSPSSMLSDEEVRRRFMLLYKKGTEFPEGQLDHFRERFCSLSRYMKDIKQTFSRIYNRKKKRKGTLWGERFKSVIVEKGNAVINCLAYIDLNAVRAGIVKRPEAYRWCSIGYHAQTDNKDDFLSLDFGLAEFGVENSQRLKKYREYLYHAGAVKKRGKANISKEILEKASAEDFELDWTRRFRYRTRYFSDSGIIGSKAFVLSTYDVFKERLFESRERVPKRVTGLHGMYSMKRLSER